MEADRPLLNARVWIWAAAIALLAIDVGTWTMIVRSDAVFIPIGRDFVAYRDAASSWLAGGPFYHPYQLAGPYPDLDPTLPEPILYPPVALWLFVPFTVLPAVLWWAIPIAVVAIAVIRCPSRPRQVLALALILWPQTWGMVGSGNPGMWMVAFLALAPAGSPFVLMKPSLAPFALFGFRRRPWFISLIAFGLLCLPFGAMWSDWITAIRNFGASALWSLSNVAPMLIPIAAAGDLRGRVIATRRPLATSTGPSEYPVPPRAVGDAHH